MTTMCRTLSLALACSGLTLASRGQIDVDWVRAYDLPESIDGDSYTDAITIDDSGNVIAAVRSWFVPGSRFIERTPTGTMTWSKLYASTKNYTYGRILTASGGGSYFIGAGTSVSTQGFMVVRLAANGGLLWQNAIPATTVMFQRVSGLFDSNGDIAVVGVSMSGTQPTLLRGFSPSGTPVYSVDIEFGPSTELVQDTLLAANGEIVIAGRAGSDGFVAGVANGQVVWMHSSPGSAQLGARYDAVARDGLELVAAGVTTISGSSDMWITCLDAAGYPLWSSAIDAGYDAAEIVYDVEFASDGALWVAGATPRPGGTTAVILRFPRGSSIPDQTLWDGSAMIRSSAAKHLFAGSPGQVWATVEFSTFGWSPAPRVGLLQLDFDHGVRVDLRAHFGDGVDEKLLACAAIGHNQRIAIGGRSSNLPGGPFFFDPISMQAQFDVSAAATGYCQAQPNSLGCIPVLTCVGWSSLESATEFTIRVSDVLAQTSGLYFYGSSGASNTPFLGGTKCVANPVARAPLLDSGGNPGGGDCSGAFALDWNAFAAGQLGGSPAPELGLAGTTIHLQCWSRDSAAPSGSNLSSGLRYVVLP